jgi:hypothetical protein
MEKEKWVLPEFPFTLDPDLFSEAIQKHIQQQNAVKENFIARYLAETGAKISETVLVEQISRNGLTTKYWCEPKTKT